MDDYDTFWSRRFKGWYIHGKHNRTQRREEISILSPDNVVTHIKARTLGGAQRAINRMIQKATT